MTSARYALITGSSSGLGLEMTEFLLDEGFVVFGLSRSGTDLSHGNFIDLICDIRLESEVSEVFAEIAATTAQLEIVVNNAGIFQMGPLIEVESETFLDHFETNALGAFHILKYCYDYLIEGNGHVINILSLASQKSFPQTGSYSASQFALRSIVETYKEEWNDEDIRFSNMYCGAIDTPLWEKFEVDDFPRNKMLKMEDFIYIFQMLIRSPSNIQFPEIMFLHKDAMIE